MADSFHWKFWAAALSVLLGACLAIGQATRTVSVGTTFSVALPWTAGTGYSWRVAPRGNRAILRQVGRVVHQYPQPGRAGASGRAVFQFQALAPGTTSLRLELRRWWDPKSEPAGVYHLKVVSSPP